MKRKSHPARFWLSGKLDRPLPEDLREEYFLRLSAIAQFRYEPSFYPGEIAMFWGEGLYDDDPKIGWGDLAGSVVTYCVPGTHRDNREAMAEPDVEVIADGLRDYLAAARGEAATAPVRPEAA
jgi:hypothetical protein